MYGVVTQSFGAMPIQCKTLRDSSFYVQTSRRLTFRQTGAPPPSRLTNPTVGLRLKSDGGRAQILVTGVSPSPAPHLFRPIELHRAH